MKNFLIFMKCHRTDLHISKIYLIFALRKNTKTIKTYESKGISIHG